MMKIKTVRICILLFVVISLSSCETLVTQNNLRLSKGTTLENFKKENIEYVKNVLLEKLSAKNKAKYEVFATRIEGANVKEFYYFAFENDKLIYWGYPYQFTRSENVILKEIGEETFKYILKEYDLVELSE